jgi:hypothetical protein
MISVQLIPQMIAWKRQRRQHLHASPDHGNPSVSEKAPSCIHVSTDSTQRGVASGFVAILDPASKSCKRGLAARLISGKM